MLTRSCTLNTPTQDAPISQSYDNHPPSLIFPLNEQLATLAVASSSYLMIKPRTFASSASSNTPVYKPSLRVDSQRTLSRARASSSKKNPKTPYPKSKPGSDREARVRELKKRATKIQSTGNAPASELQRRVLLMVFEEITPYPDESWLSQIAIIIHREYSQVKNWFSNQRQKEAKGNRENADYDTSSSQDLGSSLRRTLCDGRTLRLRPLALQCFKEEEWTDELLKEIVMIHHFILRRNGY